MPKANCQKVLFNFITWAINGDIVVKLGNIITPTNERARRQNDLSQRFVNQTDLLPAIYLNIRY